MVKRVFFSSLSLTCAMFPVFCLRSRYVGAADRSSVLVLAGRYENITGSSSITVPPPPLFLQRLNTGEETGSPRSAVVPPCRAGHSLPSGDVRTTKTNGTRHYFVFLFLFSHTFTFQLLDKPWVQVSSLLPPGSCLQFLSRIGFSNPTARRFFIEFC